MSRSKYVDTFYESDQRVLIPIKIPEGFINFLNPAPDTDDPNVPIAWDVPIPNWRAQGRKLGIYPAYVRLARTVGGNDFQRNIYLKMPILKLATRNQLHYKCSALYSHLRSDRNPNRPKIHACGHEWDFSMKSHGETSRDRKFVIYDRILAARGQRRNSRHL